MDINTTDFFNTVKKAGQLYHKNESESKIWSDMNVWSNAYNKANELEKASTDKTFLFSAQHKDCIILATMLTALYQRERDSNKIIWRPQVFTDENINKKKNRESDKYAINMSASLSLLDWNQSESANSFLNMNSISNAQQGSCANLFNEYIPKYLLDIKDKYYERLKNRYLCMYEFNNEQLNKYVRLSKAWGEFTKNSTDMKQKIKDIKNLYVSNCSISDTDTDTDTDKIKCEDYLWAQNIQSRILTTTPKSTEPYINITLKNKDSYLTHILEPNDDTTYSDMKTEIIAAIKKKDIKNRNLIGGRKKSKLTRKQSKRTRTRFKYIQKQSKKLS